MTQNMESSLTMMTWESEKRKMWEQMNKNTQKMRGIKDQYGQHWKCLDFCDSGNVKVVQVYSNTWYENPNFSEDHECYSCYPKWDEHLNQLAKSKKKIPSNFRFAGQSWDCKLECGRYYNGCDNICYVCMPDAKAAEAIAIVAAYATNNK